jgi:hypothetical protein
MRKSLSFCLVGALLLSGCAMTCSLTQKTISEWLKTHRLEPKA